MKFLRHLILVLLLGICVGCETSLTNMAQVGDFSGVASNFPNLKKTYKNLDTHSHYNLCQSLLSLRRFTSFFKCHKALKKRISGTETPAEPLQFNGQEVNQSWEIVALNTLSAQAYLELGDNKKAIKLSETALSTMKKNPISPKGGEVPLMGSIYEGIRIGNKIPLLGIAALAHTRAKNRVKSQDYITELKTIDTTGAASGFQSGIRRFWLARSQLASGNYIDAYQTMRAEKWGAGHFAMVTFIKSAYLNPAWYVVSPFEYGTINQDDLSFTGTFEPSFLKAKTALLTNRYDEARKGYDIILNEPRVKSFGFVHYGALHGKGLVDLKQRKYSQAINNFEAAIKIIEQQRSSLNTDQYKIGFVGDKQTVYWDLVETLIKVGRVREAFQRAEQAKARALVDMLASRQNFTRGKASIKTETMLAQLKKFEIESLKITSKDQQGIKLRAVKIRKIKDQIAGNFPEVASLTTIQPSRLDVLQQRLSDNETLLEYYGNKNNLLAFVVTKNSVTVSKLNGIKLSKSVKNFRRYIEKQNRSFSNASKQLYRRLISPISQKIKGKTLTIVPHGPLHYLPFSALKGPKGYLIKSYNIRILPSASVLKFLQSDKPAELSLLALGNPDLNDPKQNLSGAQAETKVIKHSWPQSKVLLRQYASEANFKKFAGSARYIHLATHGKFNPKTPLQSRLLLAKGDGEDGNLTVDELYNLTLNAELVTLSACQTGLGDVAKGDDVVGLNRGFLFAGAKSIISSLWSVSDSATAVLMKNLYANLKKQGKATALRNAQLATMKKYPHPFYWAAFQLNGGV